MWHKQLEKHCFCIYGKIFFLILLSSSGHVHRITFIEESPMTNTLRAFFVALVLVRLGD